jgi:hypothetical protein
LVARLDRYAAFMQSTRPGFKISRVDALRVLLLKSLEEAEAKKSYVALHGAKEVLR